MASDFGKRLRELRLQRAMTQRDLADTVSARLRQDDQGTFDFTYLSKIENGRMPPPSTTTILKLAEVLHANADELLALAGKAPPDLGEALKQSQGARTFFRSAKDLGLSEKDWEALIEEMRRRKEAGS